MAQICEQLVMSAVEINVRWSPVALVVGPEGPGPERQCHDHQRRGHVLQRAYERQAHELRAKLQLGGSIPRKKCRCSR